MPHAHVGLPLPRQHICQGLDCMPTQGMLWSRLCASWVDYQGLGMPLGPLEGHGSYVGSTLLPRPDNLFEQLLIFTPQKVLRTESFLAPGNIDLLRKHNAPFWSNSWNLVLVFRELIVLLIFFFFSKIHNHLHHTSQMWEYYVSTKKIIKTCVELITYIIHHKFEKILNINWKNY